MKKILNYIVIGSFLLYIGSWHKNLNYRGKILFQGITLKTLKVTLVINFIKKSKFLVLTRN